MEIVSPRVKPAGRHDSQRTPWRGAQRRSNLPGTLRQRRKIVGDFELNVAFRFGGMPYEVAERGLKLFAKEVLPVLPAQSPAAARQAAE
jgi:hypothetical protein